MDTSTVMWVIVAVVIALVVIAVAVALTRRASAHKVDRERERAGELREQAAATQEGIRRHQAEADAAEARSREIRAEADRKRAEANRLEVEAREKKSTLHEHVQRRDEVLAEADELDPDFDRDAEPRRETADPDLVDSDETDSEPLHTQHTGQQTGQHRG